VSVGVLSKRMNGLIWVLAWKLLSTLCFKEIHVSTKIRVLPSGTLSQTPDFENFASPYRSSKRVVDYKLDKGERSERDKLDRCLSTKLIIPQSSDARPLQFIAESVKLCLQHDCVARVN